MNTRHLEFFKNIYYKWSNERPLGVTHMYLFIFKLHCIHCDLYNILVYDVIAISFSILYGHFMTEFPAEGYSFDCIRPMLNFLILKYLSHRGQC